MPYRAWASGSTFRNSRSRRVEARWGDFLLDDRVRLFGLQGEPGSPHANLFVFEHACGSSVSVLASRLRHLLDEPELDPSVPWYFGAEECRQHCASIEDHARCDRLCANVRDRRLLELLLEIKARGLPARLLDQLSG